MGAHPERRPGGVAAVRRTHGRRGNIRLGRSTRRRAGRSCSPGWRHRDARKTPPAWRDGAPGGAPALGRPAAPSDIDHVNAHATSTPEGDKAELQAIRTIFGDHAPRVAVTANKSMLGHTLGAAGAIEAIATILALRNGRIPPTINLDDPILQPGLDLTPRTRPPAPRPSCVELRSGSAARTPPCSLRTMGRMTDLRRSPVDGVVGS
jgi:hypothetical protein